MPSEFIVHKIYQVLMPCDCHNTREEFTAKNQQYILKSSTIVCCHPTLVCVYKFH